MTNQSLNRAIFDLECRLSELLERRTLIWLDLQDASPENGESALLEISLHDIEVELSEARGDLARLDDDDRKFFK
jgi:hypothetical protein